MILLDTVGVLWGLWVHLAVNSEKPHQAWYGCWVSWVGCPPLPRPPGNVVGRCKIPCFFVSQCQGPVCAEWGLTRACPTSSVLSIYFPVFSCNSEYPCLPLPQIMDKCFIFVDTIDYFLSILLSSLNISEALRSRSRLPISKIMTAGSVKK